MKKAAFYHGGEISKEGARRFVHSIAPRPTYRQTARCFARRFAETLRALVGLTPGPGTQVEAERAAADSLEIGKSSFKSAASLLSVLTPAFFLQRAERVQAAAARYSDSAAYSMRWGASGGIARTQEVACRSIVFEDTTGRLELRLIIVLSRQGARLAADRRLHTWKATSFGSQTQNAAPPTDRHRGQLRASDWQP